MINAIDLTKLRNAEYIQLMHDVLKLVAQNDAATLKVTDEYNRLQAATSEIEIIFKTEQSSALTPVIEALDGRRDNAIMGIFKIIEAYTYHFTPAVKDPADLLAKYLELYGAAGTVAGANLQAETATVSNMVTDLETRADLIAAITKLGIANWVTELKTANQLFSEKYIARTSELANNNPSTIKQKRIDGNTAFYQLRDMLQSYHVITKGAAPYPKTINEINALIDQYNVILIKRATEAKVKDDTTN